MKSAFEPWLIGMEAFAVCTAFSFFFCLCTKYTSIETQINNEINNKSNIRISAETYNDQSLTYITGSEVLNEILNQDGRINIIVDNTPINSLKAEDGNTIFEAIQNGEDVTDIIENKISLKRSYSKEYQIDKKGYISGIKYTPI